MSLRQILKMGLPLVGMAILADVADGFPDQTILLIIWLARWLRW